MEKSGRRDDKQPIVWSLPANEGKKRRERRKRGEYVALFAMNSPNIWLDNDQFAPLWTVRVHCSDKKSLKSKFIWVSHIILLCFVGVPPAIRLSPNPFFPPPLFSLQ